MAEKKKVRKHGSYWGQRQYEQYLKEADPNYKPPKQKAPMGKKKKKQPKMPKGYIEN